jgi:hypothetical protein
MRGLTLRDPAFLGRLNSYPSFVQEFLERRIAADILANNTEGLEPAVMNAFSTAIQSLVTAGFLGVGSDGLLTQANSIIKAGVPMLGARTLQGALVPWARNMPTPTNFNFVPGDYSRRTGLGDPANTNKYLAMNYNNNLPPQNNIHQAVWVSAPASGAAVSRIYIGAGSGSDPGATHFAATPSTFLFFRNRNDLIANSTSAEAAAVGFIGHSRSVSANYVMRYASTNVTFSQTSQTPYNGDTFVFARSTSSGPNGHSNARIAVASVGLSLDQAIYESILATLVTSIAAAIP